MSRQLINRSWDLQKLQNEGYELEIKSGFLLVKGVPYVNSRKEVQRGTLVVKLVLAGDKTTGPTIMSPTLQASIPATSTGRRSRRSSTKAANASSPRAWSSNTRFRRSRSRTNYYPDYHAKIATYAAIFAGPAQVIDPDARPQTFKVVPDDTEPDKRETPSITSIRASSRAEIDVVTAKLKKVKKLAIVGLGGTGSYVLDLVAKTPVWEIHLYDKRPFLQHNAFRSPGAPSLTELEVADAEGDVV